MAPASLILAGFGQLMLVGFHPHIFALLDIASTIIGGKHAREYKGSSCRQISVVIRIFSYTIKQFTTNISIYSYNEVV